MVTLNAKSEPQPATRSSGPNQQPTNGINPEVPEDCQAVHGDPIAATTDDSRGPDMDPFPFLVTIFTIPTLPSEGQK